MKTPWNNYCINQWSHLIWKKSLYYVASRYVFLSALDAESMMSEWQLYQVDIIFSETDHHVLIKSTDKCLVKPLASLTRTLSHWWWPWHHVLSIIQVFCFLRTSYWEWRFQHLNLGDENIHCIIMYRTIVTDATIIPWSLSEWKIYFSFSL